jgi:hypothetical protein
MCLSWRWICSLSMCLGLCVLGCLCRLAVLLGLCWALGNASVRSATRGGGRRVLWCSVRRACVGSTGRVVVLPVHSRCEIGCVAHVRWWCLSLLLVLFVVPLRTFPAGKIFLSFFLLARPTQLQVCCMVASGNTLCNCVMHITLNETRYICRDPVTLAIHSAAGQPDAETRGYLYYSPC